MRWAIARVALSLPGSEVIHKVPIIPRGVGALGYTIQRPTEDRFLMTVPELENKMAVLLGGRAAEAIVFNRVSTGGTDHLAKVTPIARSMVAQYGMDKTSATSRMSGRARCLLAVLSPRHGSSVATAKRPRVKSIAPSGDLSVAPSPGRPRFCATAARCSNAVQSRGWEKRR
jgi:cell division protease FtsH